MLRIRKIKESDNIEWVRGKGGKDFLVYENPKEKRKKKLRYRLQEKLRNGSWYKISEVEKMIGEGQIFCGVTLAALNLVLQKLNK